MARNIAAARSARGLTQDALATAAGVSRATVVQIESGIGDIKLSTLAELAAALGTSPIILLMGEVELKALKAMLNDPGRVERIQSVLDERSRRPVAHLPRAEKTAGEIGARAASSAGLSAGAAVGAAIGTILSPGIGTAVGAALGSLLGHKLNNRSDKER